MPARRVTIVGKRGVIGRFFARRLEAAGHDVAGFASKGWDEAPALLARAELVIVSVPIGRVVGVVERAAPMLAPETTLADVTSVKQPAFEAMMRCHPGPVVGLHPMFGPGVETFSSQAVVVCHGRGREDYEWFLDSMRADGARLVEAAPDEHDRMMVAVQAVRHFVTMALGRFFIEEGVDLSRSLEFASPVYRLELDFIGRLFAQDAGMYTEIMLATPERREALGRLAESFAALAGLAQTDDREALKAEFEKVKAALGSETARALDESNGVIGMFAGMLAAKRRAE
jgi:prephenate dehydrogenase/chorismate mutase/prephenate dehydrogenase